MKFKCVLLSLILLSVNVFAIDFGTTMIGEYVYYLDDRQENRVLIGFIKISENQIMCRISNPSRKDILAELKVSENKDGTLAIKPDKTSIESDDDSNYFMDYLVLFSNMVSVYNSNGKDLFYQKTVDDVWDEFGFTLEYKLCGLIPMFNIMSVRAKDDVVRGIKIVAIGVVKENEDFDKFLKYTDVPAGKSESKDTYVLVPGKSSSAVSGDFDMRLDSNWESSGKDSFKLKNRKQSDIMLMVDKLSVSEFADKNGGDPSLVNYLELTGVDYNINPGSIELVQNEVGAAVYSREIRLNGKGELITFITIFYPLDGGKDLYGVINFNSPSGLYAKNKNYFDGILRDIKLRK